jgi:hypothetical protein
VSQLLILRVGGKVCLISAGQKMRSSSLEEQPEFHCDAAHDVRGMARHEDSRTFFTLDGGGRS